MLFLGSHITRYRYSREVFLEPHVIRLCPRGDPGQRLLSFSIDVDPVPAGMSGSLDAEGNSVVWSWFGGTTETLTVSTRFVAETLRSAPFDYILPSADAGRLPVPYTRQEQPILAPYLATEPTPGAAAFAEEIAAEADGDVQAFLLTLTDRIYRLCEVIVRDEGDPYPADQTLTDARGSCRDLAVLFVACCRHAGVAARFVSGYQEGDPDTENREMHAWAEACIPGGGWRGYDPTHGLVVADRHVAVAASAVPAGAAPVSGSLRGTGATARMEAEIDLEVRAREEGAA